MNKRILFVDDDPNTLAELQHKLRPLQAKWEIVFASSGYGALTLLAGQSVDVIVSDLRMLKMSGAELLSEVRTRFPHIVRIAMGDCLDRDLVLNSVVPTHQYLIKTCDVRTLEGILERTFALRNLLADDNLKRLVHNMQTLPSLPALYFQLIDKLRSPHSSMSDIGAIIAQDLGMTAKLLQMVNSVFFGLRRNVSSPTEAANLLGLETVVAMTLTIQVFAQLRQDHLASFSPSALWSHSLHVGVLAKRIAQVETQPSNVVQEAFTAGLLHDLGKLLLAVNLPLQYTQTLKLMRAESLTFDEAELDVFTTSHAAVGAYLLGLWGLPDALVEAVAFHGSPGACPAQQGFSALTAVHVANALANETARTRAKGIAAKFDLAYLAQLGLTDRIPVWRELDIQDESGKVA